MILNKIFKTYFTVALLLVFSANLASAALVKNLAPETTPAPTTKTVTDPITKESVLINTVPIVVDSSKIYRPVQSSSTKTLPTSAKIKIQEIKKLTPDQSANSANKTAVIADPVSAGLNFIASNQAADGSWLESGKLKFQTTAAVLDLLNSLNQKVGVSSTEQIQIDTILPKALDNLRLSFPENSDYLAQKVKGLAAAGEDVKDSADYLASQINESELSFGQKKNFGGDIITTSQILESLTAANYQDPGPDPQFTLKAALLYLLNSVNYDGGWSEIKGEESSLYATSLVLHALYPYRAVVIDGMTNGDIIIPTRISRGLNYLRGSQYSSDGSWQSNLLFSALSFDNFLIYGVEPRYKQKAIDYLKNIQNADGSFGSPAKIFATAKSINALAKPDIIVSDIQNPISVPSPNATLWITVRNDGYLTSDPINLSASPSAFSIKIDGQNIPLDFTGLPQALTFEPNSAVTFEIHFNQNLFGQHSVNFKADYAGPEFWKNNNDLTKGIAFGTPQFSGPTPPPWIGASTGPTSGEIYLTWQQSNDPARHHYVLFGSTGSGQYDLNSPLYVFPPGNFAGTNFYFDPSLYNIPLYFTIVSSDASGNHGNLAPESWAVAYANPDSYRGTLAGRVFNANYSAQGIPNAEINLFTMTSFYSDASGNYSMNFYPGFYLVSTYSSSFYSQDVAKIQITAQSSGSRDFPMTPYGSSSPPPVSGLYGSPGDNQVILNWDSYSPPSDFKEFNILRSNYYINSFESSLIIATTTNPAATSFTDTKVINGINYYYSVYARNISGGASNQNSIGPIQPGAVPTVNNISASQSSGNVMISYDLTDPAGNPSTISFEYWDGSAWHAAATVLGGGVQNPGAGKTAVWNAKKDFSEFNGQTKIKTKAYQNGAEVSAESPLFDLDTKNPTPPTVYDLPPITGLFQKTVGGTKEANTAIKSDGVEIIPQSSSTSWEYPVALKQGTNTFSFTAVDTAGNESASSSVSTTYDPNYFICGDINGDELLDVFDLSPFIDVIFSGHAYPPHPSRMDVNSDDQYDVFDLIYLINYIFSGGPAPTCPAT